MGYRVFAVSRIAARRTFVIFEGMDKVWCTAGCGQLLAREAFLTHTCAVKARERGAQVWDQRPLTPAEEACRRQEEVFRRQEAIDSKYRTDTPLSAPIEAVAE